MKILIINPNSSEEITSRIRREVDRVSSLADHEIRADVITSVKGPAVIETAHDELLAAFYAAEELKKREKDYDAAVIACAADPGLSAAKEILSIPVTGMFEAAVHVTNMLGSRFSVIGSCGHEDISAFVDTVRRYGYETRLASVKYIGSGVGGVREGHRDILREKTTEARDVDGAGAVILGCAAFAGMGKELSEECGIYVTEGIAEAIYMTEMMVRISLSRKS